MNATQAAVSAGLSEAELIFANMTANITSKIGENDTNEELRKYLETANKQYGSDSTYMPDFLKVYAYIRGEFLDGSGWIPPEGYSPPERPWHIGVMESGGEIFFTEPYIDADTGEMCISFSQQIFDASGESCGVAAIDLNLYRVTTYAANQEIANDGYGVLLDDNMRFTTHRDSSLIGVEMSAVSADYGVLADMLIADRQISAQRFKDTDGVSSIGFFRTIFR